MMQNVIHSRRANMDKNTKKQKKVTRKPKLKLEDRKQANEHSETSPKNDIHVNNDLIFEILR